MTQPKEPPQSPKGTKNLTKEAEKSGRGRTRDAAHTDNTPREDREARVREVMSPRDRGAAKS